MQGYKGYRHNYARTAILHRGFKKKVDTAIKRLFPGTATDSNIEYYETLLQHTKLQLESILNPKEDTEIRLKAAFNKLLDFNKPQILDLRKKDNVITQLDKNYAKTMLAFQENGIQGKDFTIFEFHNTLEYFEKRNADMKEKTDKLNKK